MVDTKRAAVHTKRIMITSPSLNVKDNVSGISSLVADIMRRSKFEFVHFLLGSKDVGKKKKNLAWAFGQVYTYVKLISTTLFTRFEIVHLNVGLEKFSIIRDSLVFFIVNKIFGKKVILHIHGGYYLINEPGRGLVNFLLHKIFKKAQRIIVLSELEKAILTKRYGEIPIYVFPNAVDITSVNGVSKRTYNERIRFVFMGRIVKMKGVYTISDSLQYLTQYFDRFTLDIYGAGDELNDWIASLNRYPGFEYSYKGVVGGKDKWDAFYAADVFLLPSLHSEGMPIAMIEAMAAGCAVIVTDVASVKAVIENNVNGILLSESSPQLLALKMEEIILGKANIKSIGENAKQYVMKNLSLTEYISKLEHLYTSI